MEFQFFISYLFNNTKIGAFLAVHYTPNLDFAFNSVEHIMRDVNNGWLIRYTHANIASFFYLYICI